MKYLILIGIAAILLFALTEARARTVNELVDFGFDDAQSVNFKMDLQGREKRDFEENVDWMFDNLKSLVKTIGNGFKKVYNFGGEAVDYVKDKINN